MDERTREVRDTEIAGCKRGWDYESEWLEGPDGRRVTLGDLLPPGAYGGRGLLRVHVEFEATDPPEVVALERHEAEARLNVDKAFAAALDSAARYGAAQDKLKEIQLQLAARRGAP